MKKDVPILKAISYVRVSTTKEEQLSSYVHQMKVLAEGQVIDTVMANGDPVRLEIVKQFKDYGKSGTSTKSRKQYNAAIEYLKANDEIRAMISTKTSRMNREILEALSRMDEIGFSGKHLFVTKFGEITNVDKYPDKKKRLDRELVRDTEYSIDQRESTNDAIEAAYKSGSIYSGVPIFGLTYKNKKYIHNEETQYIVEAYKMVISGSTPTEIARYLKLKVPTEKWHAQRVKKLLMNWKFAGLVLQGVRMTGDMEERAAGFPRRKNPDYTDEVISRIKEDVKKNYVANYHLDDDGNVVRNEEKFSRVVPICYVEGREETEPNEHGIYAVWGACTPVVPADTFLKAYEILDAIKSRQRKPVSVPGPDQIFDGKINCTCGCRFKRRVGTGKKILYNPVEENEECLYHKSIRQDLLYKEVRRCFDIYREIVTDPEMRVAFNAEGAALLVNNLDAQEQLLEKKLIEVRANLENVEAQLIHWQNVKGEGIAKGREKQVENADSNINELEGKEASLLAKKHSLELEIAELKVKKMDIASDRTTPHEDLMNMTDEQIDAFLAANIHSVVVGDAMGAVETYGEAHPDWSAMPNEVIPSLDILQTYSKENAKLIDARIFYKFRHKGKTPVNPENYFVTVYLDQMAFTVWVGNYPQMYAGMPKNQCIVPADRPISYCSIWTPADNPDERPITQDDIDNFFK